MLVLVLSLAGRLVWGALQPASVDARLPDQSEYLQLGKSLLSQHRLDFYDPRFGQHLRAYRTPGYPLFLAALGAQPRLIRIGQALLDTSTVLAAFLLARRWMTGGWSVVAAAFVAANPFLLYFSGLLLSETLFTAMLAWGMVLLAYRPNFLWGGILLALSVLVRPSALLLPLILGYAAVFVTHVPGQIVKRSIFRLPVGMTMILLVMFTLLPWAIRNRTVLGQWVFLTTNSGITQYDGFNPDATGASDQSFVSYPEFRQVLRLNEVARDRFFADAASRWVSDVWQRHPRRLVKLTLAKIGRTWSPLPLSADFGSRTLYVAAGLLYSIPLDLLAVLGLWKSGLRRRGKVFLLAPVLYFTLVHALTVGSLRYRMPVEPMLAVLAAAGLAWLAGELRANGPKPWPAAERD